MPDPSFSSTSYSPDRLIAGDGQGLVTREVVLTESQSQGALLRGAVLGTADDSDYARVHQTGSYGAATASAILAQDADPSGGDVNAIVYVSGEFNEDSLTLGGTVTLAQVQLALQNRSIHLKAPVSA